MRGLEEHLPVDARVLGGNFRYDLAHQTLRGGMNPRLGVSGAGWACKMSMQIERGPSTWGGAELRARSR